MTKSSIAIAGSLMLLAVGCGGSSHSTTAATTTAASGGKGAACAKAKAAHSRYSAALGALGLNLLNKQADQAPLAAIKEFRGVAEELQRSTSSLEKQQSQELATALSRQEKELMAFAAHDPAAASTYAKGLNAALFKSLANLGKICPGA